jgi:hypothetical protein
MEAKDECVHPITWDDRNRLGVVSQSALAPSLF